MKKFLISAFLAIVVSSGYSQSTSSTVPLISNYASLPSFAPKSTEAASLMKAIMYPVNYSTGLPQIEIPIYEIKLKDGTVLPIKLTYHASGYKPTEEKQRIGIGWTLEAEPQISRSVNGNPDEEYYLTHTDHNNLIGDDRNRTEAIYGGDADFQPDHFFYKLMNKSGSFISKSPVTGDGDWQKCFFTVPYDPITIYGSPDDYFLINDNGYRYAFTKKNSMSRLKIRNTSFTSYELTQYPTVYKTDLIVSPFNEEIKFSYSDFIDDRNGYNKITRRNNTNSYSVWVEEPTESVYAAPLFSQDGLGFNLGYGKYYIMDLMSSIYSSMVAQGETNSRFGGLIKTTRNFYEANTKYGHTSLIAKNGLREIETYALDNEPYSDIPLEYRDNSIERFGQLSNIQFPDGTIEFTDKSLVEGEYQVLDYILIKDKQNNIIKKIQLITHLATTDKHRALLDKVCFKNADGTTEYEYNLEYYVDPNELSGFMTNRWNDWYSENAQPKFYKPVVYKGEILQYGLLPIGDNIDNIYYKQELYDTYENSTYTPDVKGVKEFEGDYSGVRKQFVLKKIKYPTGGSCVFNYEPNRFSKYENNEEGERRLFYYYPDGLRINEIDYFDKENTLTSRRQYKYGKNEDGSGVPFIELKPEDFVITENKRYSVVARFSGLEGIQVAYKKDAYVQTYLTKPIVNPYYDVGTPILYDEVAEYYEELKENEQTNRVKTIYKYDLAGIEDMRPFRYTYNIGLNTVYTSAVAYSLDQWKIGKLSSVEQWGLDANKQTQLVSKKDYKYKTIHSQCIQNYYIPHSTTMQEVLYMVDMPIYSNFWGRIKQKAEGVRDYPYPIIVYPEITNSGQQVQSQGAMVLDEERDSTDGVVLVKKYTYDELLKHLNPTELSVSGKDKTKIDYYEKYTYSGDNENDEIAKRNILNTMTSKERWKNNLMTFKLQNNYWFFNNGEPLADLNNIPLSAFPALKEVLVGQDNNSLEVRLKYHNYDNSGNPTYISKDDCIRAVYLWGYNNQYPIAEIKNALYIDVINALNALGVSSIENQISKPNTPDMNVVNQLRQKLPNAEVTTYTYIPLVGMASKTDPRGITTYLKYDSFNRLQNIKDNNSNPINEYQYHYYNQP